jgi:hypothetical protein
MAEHMIEEFLVSPEVRGFIAQMDFGRAVLELELERFEKQGRTYVLDLGVGKIFVEKRGGNIALLSTPMDFMLDFVEHRSYIEPVAYVRRVLGQARKMMSDELRYAR